MGDFKSASLWLKLAFVLTAISLFSFHVSFLESGWGVLDNAVVCDGNDCNNDWYTGTEFCMVVAYILHLTALFLIICLILIDPLVGNKIALIVFIVCALAAGILELIGLIIFVLELRDYTYSSLHTVISAIMVIVAGVFAILEIVGVKK